ncbi:eukaryotic aspartyl protease-like protein 1 [Teratosphaeria destructans]|uniref:Eukaryotic aspartyl protease-like protein 1 n=1 Tax=Teratosphaeria destructans TaxID=418781 RepID=A0A9W7SRH8_9PEZI|nr:eukaryotic aspartyl protease-like protein 1 [Teratosphaeria destructans]
MALSIAPSEQWEGNDGPWSTFNVNIGTPLQQMRVLPATSESATIVVYQGSGCNSSCPTNWEDLRGGTFQPSSDISWKPQKSSATDPYFYVPFDTEAPLGPYSFLAAYVGIDTLRLDWSGAHPPSDGSGILDQVVGVYEAQFPWLGLLGISGRPSHLKGVNTTQNSPLLTLLSEGSIKSTFWAYTAGAKYNSPSVDGSLTFGGYDANRGTIDASDGALVVPMNSQDTSLELQLAIQSITVSGSPGQIAGLPLDVVLDSTVPEIWLPNAIADSIAGILGLVWNDTYSVYLINNTQDTSLSTSNPSVSFLLAANSSVSGQTTITLPYAALSRTAYYPLYGITANTTSLKYLGIKRTGNDTTNSQCYLGRTFFQEAYFTVSPAQHVRATNIITVESPGGSGSGLSGGAIAGVVIGAIAALGIVAGLVWFFWWRKRLQRRRRQLPRFLRDNRGSTIDVARSASMDATTAVDDQEMTGRERVEEYFAKTHRPSESHADESGFVKIELDANSTARGHPYARHELPGDPAPHEGARPPPRSGVSWGSGVSPVGLDGRHLSMPFGEPSPPLGGMLGHHRHRTTSDGSVPGVSPRSQHARHFSDSSVPSVEERPTPHGRATSDGSIPGIHELG